MNQIDILNSLIGVSMTECARKESFRQGCYFIEYRCGLAAGEITDKAVEEGVFDLICNGDVSEAYDEISKIVSKEFERLDEDYEILVQTHM